MNTLKEFKNDMDWSMLGLSEEQTEQIYYSVVDGTYEEMNDLLEDLGITDEEVGYLDADLISVLEPYGHIISDIGFEEFYNHIVIYYLKEDDLYVLMFD